MAFKIKCIKIKEKLLIKILTSKGQRTQDRTEFLNGILSPPTQSLGNIVEERAEV